MSNKNGAIMNMMAAFSSLLCFLLSIGIGYYSWFRPKRISNYSKEYRKNYRGVFIFEQLSKFLDDHAKLDIIFGKLFSIILLLFALILLKVGISGPFDVYW